MGELTKSNSLPSEQQQSRQYDLFSSFFGDTSTLSNTMELWDAIPKYALSARQQNAKRDEQGHLKNYKQSFEYRSISVVEPIACSIAMQPARIEEPDGTFKEYFPSQSEELVEEVLKKIFTDQRYGFHDAKNTESWVHFSLHMIKKELALRGHTRSIPEIKKSLEIMSKTIIEVQMKGRGRGLVYSNPILSNMTRQTREDLAEDPTGKWAVQLPALISKSVNDLSYRQYNYLRHMNLSKPFTRWMHKRLVHRYRNASLISEYHFLLSSVRRDSGFLTYERNSANIKLVNEALDELQETGVLHRWEKVEVRKGNAILDVKYSVWATFDFKDEVKAAHARLNDARKTMKISQGSR